MFETGAEVCGVGTRPFALFVAGAVGTGVASAGAPGGGPVGAVGSFAWLHPTAHTVRTPATIRKKFLDCMTSLHHARSGKTDEHWKLSLLEVIPIDLFLPGSG